MAIIVLIIILIEIPISLTYFSPPHRGDLTVEEYVENVKHYEEIYEIELEEYNLKSNGTWEEEYNYKRNYLPYHLRKAPTLNFRLKDGIVEGVSFEINVEDTEFYIESHEDLMVLLSLAFATPDSMFTDLDKMNSIYREISSKSFESLELEELGIIVSNKVEYEGFENNGDYMGLDKNMKNNYYEQDFSVLKQ